jgi:hypothetical protein
VRAGWSERPVAGLAVTCGLAALAIGVLVGPHVLLHPGSSTVGLNPGNDFQTMTWSLGWWPWAIRHGADPLHTQLLWPPSGFSTLWMTTIPAQALLALPLTLAAGPLVAYNVLILLAVPLAAGAAYLLCQELTGRLWPSVVGGLIFGLSPYMLGHTLSQHLNLTFVFPMPLLVLLAVRVSRGKTSPRRFVAGFAALLLLQLGSSLELFVDLTMFLALGLAIALIGSWAQRETVLRTVRLIGLSYAICLPVLVVIAALALSAPHGHLRYAPGQYPTDLLNVIVPTQTLLTGAGHATRSVTGHFAGNIGEQAGYLGLPLLVVALLALRSEWRRGAWLAGGLLVAALVLSFGPALTVGGRTLVNLPFAIAGLPILGYALPARLAIFAALAAACLCAMWLARPQRAALRAGVAALVLLSLLPNFSASRFHGNWAGAVDWIGRPVVFGWSNKHVERGFVGSHHSWKHVVKPGSTVLVLPAGDQTPSSYWQVRTGMRFALAAPGTPFVPPKIAPAPIVSDLVTNTPTPPAGTRLGGARLRSYLLANHVNAVVVTSHAISLWSKWVAKATGARPLLWGNDRIYRMRRGLAPLSATGNFLWAKPGVGRKALLSASVFFDGHRAFVRARLRSPRLGPSHNVTLSSASGDADSPAAAVDKLGHAAVAFTEWRSHKVLMRVATLEAGRWRTATLDTRTEPVLSPKVTVTPDGTTIAVWVAEAKPYRKLRTAVLPPGGTWQRPATLETGSGLKTLALANGPGSTAVCAWRDTAASESHVRVARYGGAGRWSGTDTVASTLERLWAVTVVGSHATRLRWRIQYPDGRIAFFEARRRGSGWREV